MPVNRNRHRSEEEIINRQVNGPMSNRTAITVTDTAQQITIANDKSGIEIQNTGDNDIYLGGSGVTSANGITLYVGQSKMYYNIEENFSFYCICAALLTSTLRIAEYE